MCWVPLKTQSIESWDSHWRTWHKMEHLQRWTKSNILTVALISARIHRNEGQGEYICRKSTSQHKYIKAPYQQVYLLFKIVHGKRKTPFPWTFSQWTKWSCFWWYSLTKSYMGIISKNVWAPCYEMLNQTRIFLSRASRRWPPSSRSTSYRWWGTRRPWPTPCSNGATRSYQVGKSDFFYSRLFIWRAK